MSNFFANDVCEFKITFWTIQTIIIFKNQTKNKITITQILKNIKISLKWINANKQKRLKIENYVKKNKKFDVVKFRTITIMYLNNAWSYYQLTLFAINFLTNILKIFIDEKSNVLNNKNRKIAFKTIKKTFSTFEFHQINFF